MRILVVLRDKDEKIKKKIIKIFSRVDKKIISKFVWKNSITKKHLDNKDLIISVGGDGTFLSASHFIENQPILGVNSNTKRSEGALTSSTLENLEKKLKKIIKGKFKIKNYERIQTKIKTDKKELLTKPALNEIFIGNINPHHISNYIIKKKKFKEFQKSSGILVTTGTGSKAWYKAMGGKPFKGIKKELRFKIREPSPGKMNKIKLKHGKINKNEKLEIISKMNHGILTVDSIREYKIKDCYKISISLGKPLRVIQ